jgi:hypothetical protein
LSRQHLVDGVYRLDAGARLDAFGPFLPASGVLVGLAEAHGAASHRQMVPVVQDVLLYGVTTRFGEELVGWQRWRRPLLAQTRDQVIVCAHGDDGIFPLAAYSRLLGVQRHDVLPDIGRRPQVLAKYRLSARDEPFYWNFSQWGSLP